MNEPLTCTDWYLCRDGHPVDAETIPIPQKIFDDYKKYMTSMGRQVMWCRNMDGAAWIDGKRYKPDGNGVWRTPFAP